MSDSPVVAEVLAGVGYGHIVIDHEHAPTDVRSGQALLRAIDAADGQTEAIVRVPGPEDPVYMKRVLDTMRLPGGILVPMVETAEMAKNIVSSTKYPPAGTRGCAVPFVRGSKYGMDDGYVGKCNSDLLLLLQVETPQAIEKIPEMAEVPGVDGIFIGPFDLSCSLGKMGEFEDDEVKEVLSRAEQAVLSSGTLLAGFRQPNRSVKSMFESGYRLVCGTVDLGLLKQAALQDLASAGA